MRPVRAAEGDAIVELFSPLDDRLETLVADLLWWTEALRRARR